MKAIIAKYILDVNGIRENMAVLIEGDKIYDVIPKDTKATPITNNPNI